MVSVLFASILIALLLITVISGMTKKTKVSEKNLAQTNICRQIAKNTIDLIRSNGTAAKIHRVPIESSGVNLSDENWHNGSYPYSVMAIENEVGISEQLQSFRWPNVKHIYWQTGIERYRSYTPLLIQSSMNALLAIYNASASVCQNDKGVPLSSDGALAELAPDSVVENFNVTATLKIRAYNSNTGQVLPCSRPIRIRPYANVEPPIAVQHRVLDFGDFRADLGLEAEVFVKVRPTRTIASEDGRSPDDFDCSLKANFQYERQEQLPQAPELNMVGNTISVSLPHERNGPGSQVICRSRHHMYNADLSQEAIRSVDNYGNFNRADGSGGWVPCDRLTACGQNPIAVNVNFEQTQIDIQYNVPSLCMLLVEARALDTMGNLSPISAINYYDGSQHTSPPYSPSGEGNDDVGGYNVGGVEFSGLAAAQQAAAISGLAITEVTNVTNPMDGPMGATAAGLGDAKAGLDQSQSAVSNSQGLMSAAQGAVASGTASAASLGAAASQAASNTASAAAGVAQAEAGLSAAQAGAAAMGMDNPVSQAAVSQAQAAVDAAKEALAEAEAIQAALEAMAAEAEANESDGEGDGDGDGD